MGDPKKGRLKNTKKVVIQKDDNNPAKSQTAKKMAIRDLEEAYKKVDIEPIHNAEGHHTGWSIVGTNPKKPK